MSTATVAMHPVLCECGFEGTPQPHPSTAAQVLTRHRQTKTHARAMNEQGTDTHADRIQAVLEELHTEYGPGPGDWTRDALCAQVGGDLWFPAKGGGTNGAKTVCARCPVAQACRDYAIATGQQHGIWGGINPRTIAAARKNTPTPTKENSAA
ncbi:WhiB family transcriptional regulator [Ornithinimicrobium cerasi]|uniref:WhiB family transcriptional regulator n=1 Tax=Ornithinimicrobium cerasi TaxID=2248773 RepID=UPI001F266FAE|nr:WhiB family transcriptional regulator [Ornithinimicrobium cerasi]